MITLSDVEMTPKITNYYAVNDLVISCKISDVPDMEFDVSWTPTITGGYIQNNMTYNFKEKSKTYMAIVSTFNVLKLVNKTDNTQSFTCSIPIGSAKNEVADTMSITLHLPGESGE